MRRNVSLSRSIYGFSMCFQIFRWQTINKTGKKHKFAEIVKIKRHIERLLPVKTASELNCSFGISRTSKVPVLVAMMLFLCFSLFSGDLEHANAEKCISNTGKTKTLAQKCQGRLTPPAHKKEKTSKKASCLFHIWKIPVTNSILLGWICTLLMMTVAFVFYFAFKKGKMTKFTSFVEALVLILYDFFAEILGKPLNNKIFWFLGSLFLFILISNWAGLAPGIGSIGWGHFSEGGRFLVTKPLLKGVNADLNTTSALAALFFVIWLFLALKANGLKGLIVHIFGIKGDSKGILYIIMFIVFIAVGFLEVISIAIRPLALAVRLYGNIFAGEVMLETMMHKAPFFAWIVPVPFYCMEALVGFVQAGVFTLLSAVFIMLICRHDDEAAAHSGAHKQ